ncbi:L-histidine N(alpha)-methyltransferase [Thermosynechococcus sp. QKsg1]|uniref:L-histidine N(alpha)-methyltransferase n=1 Tax=unclassified Thermosynechococcus TaxID=2622553 RepID=UPI00122DE690|nr:MULTISPECIES: L-histidine N(alpha)-methyltransferase [unclassified Thermosynechococcus]QEQ02002.1 L-histidine N(alpha)-methyltransferase [Thermosynechococcus sp. CL-1]WJI26403.1 L-histidine N(alpha)-methyltransferase [Thermosynechococcus sp. B1]WJI28930.1 L-histidine N(alpha)-methyltransferase [Thermosynechococcus sp. B3]WKT83524.1 L-histidine N(alpha)-methyltransferase [Thermosynechococcus sp. HY596]WNC62655.1 L-histidine N(alpha)-methyltransferase [Thermosynechococcus sp. HY591]
MSDRLHLTHLPSLATERDGQDVIRGLTQQPKSLPSYYFYDAAGSRLFEQICELPEYYPTRTELGILETAAGAIAQLTGACELVELGSGSDRKIRLLLSAYAHVQPRLYYRPIDVSGSILKTSAMALLADYPQLSIHGLVGTYQVGLEHLPPPLAPRRLLCFLGSTIGNLSPSECQTLFQQIHQVLRDGDYFLLGVDLIKDTSILLPAYNDAQGVTAAFNRNLLHHLNWRFQGNFQPAAFAHRAIYNPIAQQIEMYLDSQQRQTVTLAALDFQCTFTVGEPILTEISRKFDLAALKAALTAAGFRWIKAFTDPQQWFALCLCQV